MNSRFPKRVGLAAVHVAAVSLVLAFPVVGCSGDDDGGKSGEGGNNGAAGNGGDSGSGGNGGSPPNGGDGSATLTIGTQTWMFSSFDCAFGHEATMSDLYSFSSNAFGVHSTGARVQMQADIEDDTGQGRYEGDGVFYTVYITDIDDFANPSVDWESTSHAFSGRPSQMTVIHIDGDHVTAEGFFDDLLTLDREEVAGTLDASCSDRSQR